MRQLRSFIQEALKRSDAQAVVSALENAAGRIGSKVSATVDESGKMLNIFVKLISGDPESTEEALTSAANQSGWSLLTRSEKRGLVWWFEPSSETKGSINRKLIPAELWHATPTQNVDSILAQGMLPRQRTAIGTTRKYSPRIYLAADPKGARATINDQADWSMLRIDVAKLPKSFKFYVDQEFGHRADGRPIAVYVLEAIPASAISVAE